MENGTRCDFCWQSLEKDDRTTIHVWIGKHRARLDLHDRNEYDCLMKYIDRLEEGEEQQFFLPAPR